MRSVRRLRMPASSWCLLVWLLALLFLAACGGGEAPSLTELPQATEPATLPAGSETAEAEEPEVEPEEEPTEEPAVETTRVVTEEIIITITPQPQTPRPSRTLAATPVPGGTTTAAPVQTPLVTPSAPLPFRPSLPAEERIAEVEWPPRLRLGESDVVRLSLVPGQEGYVLRTDFPGHRTVTTTVELEQQPGYDLAAVARLDGVGFALSPEGEQTQHLRPGEPVEWLWSVSPERTGQQRLSLTLSLRWLPQPGNPNPERQAVVLARGLNVQVAALLGLTTEQAMMGGIVGLLLGIALNLPLVRARQAGRAAVVARPANEALAIEPHPGIRLAPAEQALLQALFHAYARLALEVEFRSGYSGAR
ncbi:MAG: hypothetical protein L0332_35195, partial [Chloroflexi bacterium]|nr:hypothetical protein [Chloroflexota bacterium]MCI0645110.1 hypothetical protein [Chloroflexota bacterium]MCI0731945.1 hypothetical protein [Chloroflexota bacterium]